MNLFVYTTKDENELKKLFCCKTDILGYPERCSPDTCSPTTFAPRIGAGVGASLGEGEGAHVDGDVCVGEGKT